MTYNPPARKYGCVMNNVQSFGAIGDGKTDDTAAIQAAIDALPTAGGVVYVPAGTYLVDAVKAVDLRSNMLFLMDSAATLKVKPNAAPRYYTLRVESCTEVEIIGGNIVGDRDEHDYVDTGNSQRTHEWGMGISIRGGSTKVTVRNVNIRDTTGDAICTTGSDIIIVGVKGTNCRRQGLSVTVGSNVKVYDCEFSYINGTSPECGIDVEPDLPGATSSVWIENCHLHHNAKYGINVFKNTSNVTITNCEVDNNVNGIVTVGCTNVDIVNNYIHHNKATGVFVQTGTVDYLISQNTFGFNYTKQGVIDRTDFTQTGWSTKVQKDILLRTDGTGKVLTNYYK